jgi:aspartate aminotransferase
MSVETKSRLSSMVRNLSESETLKMAQMARNLKAQGHDVISLSIGEPDFDTPDHIKMAAIKALSEGFTKYTPVPGIPELQDAISKKFKRDNGLDFAPNQISVSNGAKQSISNVCLALLDKGDECIIFAPYWVSYIEIVKMTGATPVIVGGGVEQDFKVTAAQVEAAITDRTKMVLFSSPCNPSGSVFDKSELREIAEVIAKHDDICIVSDEIYEYINYVGSHTSIGAFDIVKDRTITVNGFAKGFAMTGWRLGYIGGPKWVVDACNKIQGQYTSGANSFSQKAAVVALNSPLDTTWKMRDEFKKRRDMVVSLLSEIPGFKVPNPQGAFYVFPDISDYFGTTAGDTLIRNADDFCDYVMTTAYVGLVSGGAFGEPKCFRLSYAASEAQLREAIKRIAAVCATLK